MIRLTASRGPSLLLRLRDEVLPSVGPRDLLHNVITTSEKPDHITLEKQLLCDASKQRQRGCKCEPISHLRLAFSESSEEVIMLHELENALDHCVLKIVGRIEGRNLAGKVLV